MGRKAFISYMVEDRSSAVRVAELLAGVADLEVFYDGDDIRPGDNFIGWISGRLQDADVVVVLFGPRRRRPGSFAEGELDAAIARAHTDGLAIVPVLLPGHPEDGRGNPDRSMWPALLHRLNYVDFRGGFDDYATRRALREALRRPAGGARRDDPPYPGLRAYGPADKADFVGRDREVEEVMIRLRNERVVVVVGASGSGKTSLVRGGLVPRLAGAEGPAGPWAVSDLPLPARDELDTDDELPAEEWAVTPVLVVDELDGLFVDRPAEAVERFVARLVAAATDDSDTRVLATLRADFVGEAAAHPLLRGLLNEGQYLLGPLSGVALRDAIELPARAAGARFEPGLVTRIMRDYDERSGALPLLNQALRSLWLECDGDVLTLAAYEERLGGLNRALDTTAEAVWNSLSEPDREVTRAVLLRLAVPRGLSGAAVSRARSLRDLVSDATEAQVNRAVEAFVAARLLQADGEGGDRTVDVTHDAVFRAWSRLRSWVEEAAADTARHSVLERDVQEWNDHDHDGSYLYGGEQLNDALRLAERIGPSLSEAEQAFLGRSSHRESRRRRVQRIQLVAAVGLVLAIATNLVLTNAWRTSRNAQAVAQALRLSAEADRLLSTDRDAALLLSAEAAVRSDAPEPLGTLTHALATAPLPRREQRRDREVAVSVAASPDGSLLLGRKDGRVEVQELDSTDPPRTLTVSSQPVVEVAAIASGDVLAVDDTGLLTRTDASGVTTVVTTWPAPVEAFAVDQATHESAVVVGRDVIVVDAEGSERARWDLGPPDEDYPGLSPLLALSPDRSTVVVVDAHRLLVGDRSAPDGGFTQVAVLPGGGTALAVDTVSNRVAVGDDEGRVTLVALSTREVSPSRLSMPVGGVYHLAFPPDGSILAGANEMGAIVLWDLDRAAVALGPVESRSPGDWAADDPSTTAAVTDLTFVTHQRLVALDRNAVVHWDLRPAIGIETREWPVAGSVEAFAVTAGGDPVTVSSDGAVAVAGAPRPDLGSGVTAVAVADHEIATGTTDGTVRRGSLTLARLDEPVVLIAAAADGTVVAGGPSSVWVSMGDSSETPVELRLAPGDRPTAVAISEDGATIAVASLGENEPSVGIWQRAGDGYWLRTSTWGHSLRIDAAAFDRNGRLVTGSDDRTAEVASPDLRFVQTLGGHRDGIIAIAVDGDRLWTSTQDGEIYGWQWIEERYVRVGDPIPVGNTNVRVAAGEPGTLVVATSTTLRTLDVSRESLVDRACRLAGRSLTSEELDALGLDDAKAC